MFRASVLFAALLASGLVQAAAFTSGDLLVYRVGAIGNTGLTNAATAVFIDEYTPTGTLVQSVAVSTTGASALTASGTASSEGGMTLSADGRYVILPGYNAAVGTAAIAGTASTAVQRDVAVMDMNGTVTSTTLLGTNVFSANNIRSAVSTNGTDLWAAGANGGVYTITAGATSGATLVSNSFTNLRQLEIYNNQLYVGSGASTLRLGTVGTGVSTATGQTISTLPGFPTAGAPSTYQYFMADLDGVAGIDTVYLADDTATTGGITKYALVNGVWVAKGTIVSANVRGLTGQVTAGGVQLYGSSGGTGTAAGGGNLLSFLDTTGYNGTFSGSLTSFATAAANTAFRGLALVPSLVTAPAVPEPGTYLMLLAGLAAIAMRARRRA